MNIWKSEAKQIKNAELKWKMIRLKDEMIRSNLKLQMGNSKS